MRRPLFAIALLPLLAAVPARAECPPDAVVQQRAAAILQHQGVPPFTGLSLADAQCAQDKLVPLLAREWGHPVGYKAGLTSTSGQRAFGLDHPVYGVIFTDTLRNHSGATVPVRDGVNLGVEADLLVQVRDEGINEARDHVEILRHLDQVIPFIELPDVPLAAGNRADGPNLVAYNVAARLGVVGTPIPAEATAEFAARLGSMTVVLGDDQHEIARAPGTALLGHPLDVVPWLAAALKANGHRLRAGDIISLGGFAPSVRAEAGRTYTLRYEGLAAGPVAVTVQIQ